jgi:hypothetical protein
MAREFLLQMSISRVEREKIEQIRDKKGFTTLAESVRYALDRVHMNEVIKEEKRA